MKPSAPLVVAGWGVINGVWVALLAGMGEGSVALEMYGSAVGLVMIIAGIVLVSRRRSRRREAGRRPWRRAPHGDSILIAGAGVALAAFLALWVRWAALIAIPPLIAAALRELTLRREQS